MSTGLTVYRALSRVVHRFSRERIPLHGVVGSEWAMPTGDNTTCLQALFRSPSDTPAMRTEQLDDGLRALRRLQEQLEVLQGAEEHTRQAMACWHELRQSIETGTAAGNQPFAGVERGSHLLQQLANIKSRSLDVLLSEKPESDAAQRSLEPNTSTAQQLDDLANAIRHSAPEQLFADNPNTSNGEQTRDKTRREMQLTHISKVLFEELRFRQMPFEWVYDGLAPALLPDVLESKKGLSIVLSAIYLMVAHRLGICLIMLPEKEQQMDSSSGLEHLAPPGLAIAASPPHPANWLLYSPGSPTLCVDPLRKGEISRAMLNLDEKVLSNFHFRVWAEQARIMVIAHQRRGESDAVAHWIYQLLALDPKAREWSEMLGLA